MAKRVFVTGIGIISAIGNDVSQTLQSLKESRSGIGAIRLIRTRHHNKLSVGEVPFDDVALRTIAGIADETIFTRTSLLGIIAATEAWKDAGIGSASEFRTGIVSATSVGGMGIAENCFMDYLNPDKNGPFMQTIRLLDCSDSTERIADHLGITHFLTTISTACSSSANSVMHGARLIKNNLLDRVVVGGTDSLSRFTINGFNCLKILDSEPCKPFDADRKGLNLGEGAAFLVLESEETAKGKKIYCELTGYGNSNDAYHQTASSPEGTGAFLAMQKAFQQSGLKPQDIGYINAHGTGTEINDLSEGLAIERIFDNAIPPVSSTKSFTGHTLAAAGGVEAVVSVLSIHHGAIFPNLNFKTPMAELKFSPSTTFESGKKINHVLSNSFGFGGNTSSLIFSKAEL